MTHLIACIRHRIERRAAARQLRFIHASLRAHHAMRLALGAAIADTKADARRLHVQARAAWEAAFA